MRKYILLILLAFASTFAYAYNFQVDGIYYNIVDKNNCIVEVTYGDAKYSGSVTIPATVKKDGVTYTVASVGISAFSNCAGLTEVKIGDGVELIYNSAFSYCTSLESVTLGSNVKKMGNNAFSHCSSLSNINLNDQIVKFGDNAFEQCTSLTSVVIGSKVEEMGSGVFQLCTNLKTVEIHEGASDIGSSAFEKCEKLTSVTIPNSVLHIGLSAFFGCSSLTEVKIGDGVETISNSAFSYCTSLNKVSLGSSVKKVNSRSFEGCNKMTSFTVKNPNPPEVTRNDAFSDYSATLYVPSGSIGAYKAHEIWKKFYKIEEGEGTSDDNIVFADAEVKRICVENWDTNGDGELSKTEAAAVTELGWIFNGNEKIKTFDELEYFVGLKGMSSTFSDCINLTSIIIPNSVQYLSWTFSGCIKLTSIIIPNSEIDISGAFCNCSGLTSIIIPDGASIGGCTFMGCSSLSSVTLPNSVTCIPICTFQSCVSLKSISLPNNLTKIENAAFYLSGLTSITIPESVNEIGNGVFGGCTNLENIKVEEGNKKYDSRNNCNAIIQSKRSRLIAGCKNTIIPNDVTSIEGRAFECCSSLTSITIPNSVTSIGGWAFAGCSGLTSITIPKSVNEIGQHVFGELYGECNNLENIKVEEGNKKYDSRNNCNAIIETASNTLIAGCKNTIIPNGVTSIGDDAFYGCRGLTSITIPDGVTSIGEYTFYNCSSLSSIIIPNSVTTIGGYAFKDTAWYDNQPDGLVYVGKVLYHYKGIMPDNTKIEIKEGTLGISEDILSNVYNYRYGVGYSNSGLVSITIPNSVTTIGSDAFYGCSGLVYVQSYIQEPFEIDRYAFYYSNSYDELVFTDATLYVPVGTKAKYEATEGWKEFKTIIEGEPSAIQGPTVITSSDIYSITGRKVRSNTTSLDGLPKGIYILNGKKVIK